MDPQTVNYQYPPQPEQFPVQPPTELPMEEPPKKPGLWKRIRRGWPFSIILGMLLLILAFKDIIWALIKAPELLDKLSATSPFWQSVVKNGVTDNLGETLNTAIPYVMLVGGCVLFAYGIVSGYLMTLRALENNGYTGPQQSAGDITTLNIVRRTLIINVPILYWAAFGFFGLPWLVKLPIASLSIGNIAALVGACVTMVLTTVLITHFGLMVTRRSLRFMLRAE
jgi:hypothetical protein